MPNEQDSLTLRNVRCHRTQSQPHSAGARQVSHVTSLCICRCGVPLTCGPTFGWCVVIGHGLSFEVSVFGSAAARCYRPRYLSIQRLNYLWTIPHSSARIAGILIT